MRKVPGGFTLVELLVVVAIISILAAMLLPTLAASLEQARRVSCLNDRRQLGLTTGLFAGDHDDRVPYPSQWNAARQTWVMDDTWYDSVFGSFIIRGSVYAGSAKTLSVMGYMSSAAPFYCPSFVPREEVFLRLDRPEGNATWNEIINGDSNLGSTYWLPTTVVDYTWSFDHAGWVAAGSSYDNTVRNRFRYPKLKVSHVSAHWRRSPGISPIIFTCLNNMTRAINTPGSNLGVAHRNEGLNAVFYDGSARWLHPSVYGNRETLVFQTTDQTWARALKEMPGN